MARKNALLGERESLAVRAVRFAIIASVTTFVTVFAIAVIVVAVTE